MGATVQTLKLDGKKFVILDAKHYEELRAAAESSWDGPELPIPDSRGHVPAIEYARASIAREVIARRRKAGWTIEQLAKKAKVQVSVIKQIEQATASASVAAVDRIDRALKAAKA